MKAVKEKLAKINDEIVNLSNLLQTERRSEEKELSDLENMPEEDRDEAAADACNERIGAIEGVEALVDELVDKLNEVESAVEDL